MKKLVKHSYRKYVVVKENEFPFCRLRRSDAIEIANLQILWEGSNIRSGYNAMIRINNENKEAKKRIFAIVNSKGNLIVKECQYPDFLGKPWQEIFNINLEEGFEKKIVWDWNNKLLNLKRKADLDDKIKLSANDIKYLCWKYKEEPTHLFLA